MVRHRLGGRRTPLAATALLLVAGVLAACTTDADPAPTPTASPTPTPTRLTLGIYGSQPEVEAFRGVVDSYTQSVDGVQIELRAYPDADRLATAVLEDADPPDVFLLSRADLEDVTTAERNTPLLELVDERGVDFGDGYSRDAVLAFSAANDQQCMPYGVSPMVVYYNTALVDFDKMAARAARRPGPRRGDRRGRQVDARAVPRGRPVRQPAPARHQGRPRRPDAPSAGAVRLLRWRRPLRRRQRAHVAGLLLRRHP